MSKNAFGDNTYDFQGASPGSTTRIAYQGTDSNQPPLSLEIGTELDSNRYNQIASSDEERALHGNDYSDYHRFKFKILEPVQTITQIYVKHEGYGLDEIPPPAPDSSGLALFIWNYASSTWDPLDSHIQGGPTDGILQKTITQNFGNYIDANGYLNLLVQTKENGGSCPFLYTFDGREYVFVADLYGNGIIDLPWYTSVRPEDYARIEGASLQPNDSLYRVKITQEYDEISYLDQTALMTVDHSLDSEVFLSLLYTDGNKIFTVSKNHASPVSAIDGNGKDILQQILHKDGIFTSSKQYQLNTMELNLGDLSDAKEIKLVISAYTRWVPGSGDSDTPVPYDRYVQVKDENDNWVNVFDTSQIIAPAAMPRTYILNLTGKFITDDYSVRLLSYPDIRFDYIGVDTSPQQEIIVNTLAPVSADLHFRGYSSLKGIPPTPDYYDLNPESPMGFSNPTGNFTRFGDVLPLLNNRDDKFVIMHHGDEISIDYLYLPVPEGMKRDFISYSWGYYKNKYYGTGDTVDPLPFHGMSDYPYPVDESYPYDSEHIIYLRQYNTRQYSESAKYTEQNENHSIYTNYVKVVVSGTIPVGGIVVPTDKLSIIAPYIALVGLIGAISTIFAIRRWRKD
jgi:hypothetical protein